jgi:hypothetical protein
MISNLLLLAPASTNPLNWLQDSIQSFDAANSGMFISIGSSLYTSFALMLIVWTGIQIALSGNFQPYAVARLILLLAFGKALIVYYGGGDYSITALVLGQARYLGERIDTNALNLIGGRVGEAFTSLTRTTPSLTNVTDTIWYFVALLAYLALQVAALFVVAFGDVAVTVCVLLGPIFLPFFIVPKLDWLFWGWFRAFLQFAFYRVVASAVLFIIASAADKMRQALPVGDAGGAINGYEFMPTVLFAIVCVMVMLKIPTLTSNIFSGSAGSDGGIVSTLQTAVRTAAMGA